MGRNLTCDIVIVGTGVAGLYCALNLPADKRILLITKRGVEESNSYLAQGGISVLHDSEDYQRYFDDTMKAGHFKNYPDSVDTLISSSTAVICDLITRGVDFTHKEGMLAYTREGGHSTARIVYHQDHTGEEVVSRLLASVRTKENVEILEYTCVTDIITDGKQCLGVWAENHAGPLSIRADYTVLASGGIGGLFRDSTNLEHITGDALAIAIRRKIHVKDIDYIQIHPTALYTPTFGRRFLISESLRGEGAILLNRKKERFTDEFLPRDKLTADILRQMDDDGRPYVWLSLENIAQDEIRSHFTSIAERCLQEGINIMRDLIPVAPAQHYHMGGIATDTFGSTTLSRLYAVGEVSNTGVHGANRLASNSLLECLVFSRRAADHIQSTYSAVMAQDPPGPSGDDETTDSDPLSALKNSAACALNPPKPLRKTANADPDDRKPSTGSEKPGPDDRRPLKRSENSEPDDRKQLKESKKPDPDDRKRAEERMSDWRKASKQLILDEIERARASRESNRI